MFVWKDKNKRKEAGIGQSAASLPTTAIQQSILCWLQCDQIEPNFVTLAKFCNFGYILELWLNFVILTKFCNFD